MNKDILSDVQWQITDADANKHGLTDVTVRKDQHITDEFLDNLKEDRAASKAPAGEYHKVASIPVAVIEKWMREGFNIFDKNIRVEEVVKRLRAEDLQAFIATDKRI
jgi:hypothetical protein